MKTETDLQQKDKQPEPKPYTGTAAENGPFSQKEQAAAPTYGTAGAGKNPAGEFTKSSSETSTHSRENQRQGDAPPLSASEHIHESELQQEAAGSSSHLRKAVDETRAKMDGTLEELGHRLNPRRVARDVGSWWEDHMNGDTLERLKNQGADVVDHVERHPVPYALVALGLGMGAYAAFKDHSTMRRQLHHFNEKGMAAADYVKEASSATAQHVREGYEHTAERARNLGRQGRSALRETNYSLQKTMEEQPLVVGAGLAAAGLIAGLLLPHSRPEDRLVGARSRAVKDEVKEAGKDLLERGKEALHETVEDAQKRAKEAGLTPETLKEKTGSVIHAAEGQSNPA